MPYEIHNRGTSSVLEIIVTARRYVRADEYLANAPDTIEMLLSIETQLTAIVEGMVAKKTHLELVQFDDDSDDDF